MIAHLQVLEWELIPNEGYGHKHREQLGGEGRPLSYELLHWVRTTALSGSWRRAQPKQLRTWLFRLQAKLTTHARKQYVQLQRAEPLRRELLQALRRLGIGPPLHT